VIRSSHCGLEDEFSLTSFLIVDHHVLDRLPLTCVGGGGAVAVRRTHLGVVPFCFLGGDFVVVVDHVDLHALRVTVPRSPSGFCAGELSL
jgi:hypothetical protein